MDKQVVYMDMYIYVHDYLAICCVYIWSGPENVPNFISPPPLPNTQTNPRFVRMKLMS